MKVLGISALYHDSAACIVSNGEILAAAQEERFTRVKHDPSIPVNAVLYCLDKADVAMPDVDAVVFYENPVKKLDRILACARPDDSGISQASIKRVESMLATKMWIDDLLRSEFGRLGKRDELYCVEHHMSHAASAYYPSPFDEAAVMTIDGVGEWASVTIGVGNGGSLKLLQQQNFPHSLGLLYSVFTSYCGFKVNSGEYKLMGLAPYGVPTFYEKIMDEIIRVNDDGSFALNLKYFDFIKNDKMFNEDFCGIFGRPARKPESGYERHYLDVAASIQKVTEEIVLKLAKTAKCVTGSPNLAMAGGVALNCVANGRLIRSGIFDEVWVQPASGDAGGALGAALYVAHKHADAGRECASHKDAMKSAFLGPSFSPQQINRAIDDYGCEFHVAGSRIGRDRIIAEYLAAGKVVGLFQGEMEFGPRALGHRSILGDPRVEAMQSRMNLQIKNRESFRPFAPSVLKEHAEAYFEYSGDSPYMLVVTDVRESRCKKPSGNHVEDTDIYKIVNRLRSDIPAVTHVDYSARLHTVDAQDNPAFYGVINEFYRQTGCPVVINTSFNIRGEPIVCSPTDAIRCFLATDMDVLVLEDFILDKDAQPLSLINMRGSYEHEYELD